MQIWELFIIAVGLAMDAFAVSICKGLGVQALRPQHALWTGLWFGGFQALMPAVGYALGIRFQTVITNVDHWIAFVLLGLIGLNMIRESFGQAEDTVNSSFAPAAMLPLAVATSIDALAVGVTFAFLQVDVVPAVSLIGLVTFALACVGVKLGHMFGVRYMARAERFGGIVLVLMGGKILLEHLGILP